MDHTVPSISRAEAILVGAILSVSWGIRSRVATASRMLLPALSTACAILIAVWLTVSSEFMQLYDSPVLDKYTSGLITRHIFNHPERYTMIRWVHEEYPAFYPALDYFVFQVIKKTATAERPPLSFIGRKMST